MKSENKYNANPSMLYLCTIISAILAIAIVYVNFADDFIHSIRFLINYFLLFALVITLCVSFKKGMKEIVKASTVSILTVALYLHWTAFMDMVSLNFYYFFSGDIYIASIAIIAVVLFFSFVVVYINHYRINSTNKSNTELVNYEKNTLIFIAILCLIQAVLVAYHDFIIGRDFEIHLILTYILHTFIAFIIINVESLINTFRLAREDDNLEKVLNKSIGKKSAKNSLPNKK